jgi:acyl carrier protein
LTVNDPALTDRVMMIVVRVLRNRLPVLRLPDNVTFHDLCVDPFERIYIADGIESEWPIQLAEDEIYGWQTVDDIVTSVRNRMPR